MCAVSAVGDIYNHKWGQLGGPTYWPPEPMRQPVAPITGVTWTPVSRVEFDALKKEVEEMKSILLKAKQYDEATGQPDCEMEEKVAILKKVAEMVGVSLDEIFTPGGGTGT